MARKRFAALALALGLALGLASVLAWPAPAQALRNFEDEGEVPNVRGKRLAEAERMLKAAGFDAIQVFEVDTDKRGLADVVREQQPLPGRQIRVSGLIKLTVYRYNP